MQQLSRQSLRAVGTEELIRLTFRILLHPTAKNIKGLALSFSMYVNRCRMYGYNSCYNCYSNSWYHYYNNSFKIITAIIPS